MKMFSTSIWLMTILSVSGSVWTGTASSEALKETANTTGFQPKDGMVPNAKTAIAIAIAVWNPVYGEKQIESQKPYNAVLRNGQWIVTGSLPNGRVGGVATAVISKIDARVIKIYHTQ